MVDDVPPHSIRIFLGKKFMVVVYHPILDWNIFGKKFVVDDVPRILLKYFW